MLASRRHSFRFWILTIFFCAALFGLSLGQLSNTQRRKPVPNHTLKLDGGEPPHKHWLEQDVRWIITDEERAAFKTLKDDEERDQFIEAFWERRNPTPDSSENPFKAEHYHRIAYVNEQFGAAANSGWNTDRGRIYIVYGQPDQIDSYPSGKPKEQSSDHVEDVVHESFPPLKEQKVSPAEDTAKLPIEVWRYRYLAGVGQDVALEFVDACRCGDYRMRTGTSERDALLRAAVELSLPQEVRNQPAELQAFIIPGHAPSLKFPDLKEAVNSVRLNPLPFEVRADFARATDLTDLVPITIAIQNRDLTFVEKNGARRATLNIFGRLSTLTGHVEETFESTLDINSAADSVSSLASDKTLHVVTLALHSGLYRMEVAIKDVNADRKGAWVRSLKVPQYHGGSFSTSPLVLAEHIDPVERDIDAPGSFRVGTSYVRPYVATRFGDPPHVTRRSGMNLWWQAYGLAVDGKTHKPSATVEYTVVDTGAKTVAFYDQHSTDPQRDLGNQWTMQETLPIEKLKPGSYKLDVQVKDSVSGETIQQSAPFTVD